MQDVTKLVTEFILTTVRESEIDLQIEDDKIVETVELWLYDNLTEMVSERVHDYLDENLADILSDKLTITVE